MSNKISVGDSVVITRNGRYWTDRAVVRRVLIGHKFTVCAVGDNLLTVQDADGNRFRIERQSFKLNSKVTK